MKTKKRMMYSPGGPYIVVAPIVTSWAVAGQQVVFLHMYLQTRVTLRAFPVATPRGRSSSSHGGELTSPKPRRNAIAPEIDVISTLLYSNIWQLEKCNYAAAMIWVHFP